MPLTKSRLADYYKLLFDHDATDRELGRVLENLFAAYINEPEGKESWGNANAHINTEKIGTGGDGERNTVPDFLADAILKPVGIHVTDAVAIELKAKGGGLYLSSNTYQMWGHITNMALKFKELEVAYHKYKFHPGVILITTADVNFSPGIADYARSVGVNYQHFKVQYSTDGTKDWKFKFESD